MFTGRARRQMVRRHSSRTKMPLDKILNEEKKEKKIKKLKKGVITHKFCITAKLSGFYLGSGRCVVTVTCNLTCHLLLLDLLYLLQYHTCTSPSVLIWEHFQFFRCAMSENILSSFAVPCLRTFSVFFLAIP